MHKTFFSYNFPFFMWFIPLLYIIEIKPAPGDHEYNFKKVGAILCGCNSKRTKKSVVISFKQFSEIRNSYPNFLSCIFHHHAVRWTCFGLLRPSKYNWRIPQFTFIKDPPNWKICFSSWVSISCLWQFNVTWQKGMNFDHDFC